MDDSAFNVRDMDMAHPHKRIVELRTRSNWINIPYLALPWIIIALTTCGTIWFCEFLLSTDYSLWWAAPVMFAAITAIGASQHQLGGALHEASHYMLFKNRRLNEIISDWVCAFPIYTTTHIYRTGHFSHHAHANDAQLDPELRQVVDSNNWPDLPQPRNRLLQILVLKLIWIPRATRFAIEGVRDYTLGGRPALFRQDVDRRWRRAASTAFLAYAIASPVILGTAILMGATAWQLGGTMLGLWAFAAVFFLFIPKTGLPLSTVPTVLDDRTTAVSRVTFLALVYATIYWAEYFTGIKFGNYFFLLWVVPMITAFSLFMVLREIAQHGNRNTQRYTQARVTWFNPIINYALFPFGNAIHLPHHLYASVPHFHLKELHQLLMEDPSYAQPGVQTRGLMKQPTQADETPGLLVALAAESNSISV